MSKKVENDGWGKSVVEQLSQYIISESPSIKGFSARNIWRMKQFFETYYAYENLSTLLTEISWTNHLHILSKTKTIKEKEYYLELAAKQHYSERDFARIIDSGTFERITLANLKLSAVLTEFPAATKGFFKDSYVFEFLGLSDNHKEHDIPPGRQILLK